MLLKKVERTIRREGPAGLWARLRYPHRPGGRNALTPAQQPPFRLACDCPALAEALRQALRRLLGPTAIVSAELMREDRATIHAAPSPGQEGIASGDVLLFTDPEEAQLFLRHGGRRVVNTVGAVLLPSVECLTPLLQTGVGEGRLFVVPALSRYAASRIADRAGDELPALVAGLARWLVAAGTLHPRELHVGLFPVLQKLEPHDRLCLSMPESTVRRADFLRQNLDEFQIFDGLRLRPGWQGAGWSHATIARAALARNAVPLLVCEDDMRPQPEFRARLSAVKAYLAGTEWDLFSGLLTDVPEDCRIHRVERRAGLTFIHLDYATGMVLNLYNRRPLERLAAWTPAGGGPETNTVDAWLSRLPGLHAVTTLPFLAKHDPTAVSTVFGFANRRYESMIRASERRLIKLATHWRPDRSIRPINSG